MKLGYFRFKICFGGTYSITSAFQNLNIPLSPLPLSSPTLPSCAHGWSKLLESSYSILALEGGVWALWKCVCPGLLSLMCTVHTHLHCATFPPVITLCLPGVMSVYVILLPPGSWNLSKTVCGIPAMFPSFFGKHNTPGFPPISRGKNRGQLRYLWSPPTRHLI